MKISIKDFFCKFDQIRSFLQFTKEILNGKLHFLCSAAFIIYYQLRMFEPQMDL